MIITIEGNIGAGKTTFAKALYEMLKDLGYRVLYVPEPVESWTNFQGTNLLDLMYNDRERWTFVFQVNALLHTTKSEEETLKCVNNGFIVIRERSSFSVRKIFAPLLSTYMSAAEERILKDLCNAIKDPSTTDRCSSCVLKDSTSVADRSLDIMVYMRTDPEICYERVKKRNRPEELQNGRVNIAYLKELHEMHEQEVMKIQHSPKHCLVVADGNGFNEKEAAVSVKIRGSDYTVFDFIKNQYRKGLLSDSGRDLK